jgi:hypothetical protein
MTTEGQLKPENQHKETVAQSREKLINFYMRVKKLVL